MKSTIRYLILLTFLASLIPAMHAQTFSVIHTFTGGTDGAGPYAGVTIRGNALYGTTHGFYVNCGIENGTVYQLTHAGSNWLFSTLTNVPHDCWPESRVVFGPDDHLYGTSEQGGMYHAGTVFKLTPPAGICSTIACYWTVTDLHDFGSGTDGIAPEYGDLIWDQQGNLYGTTVYGGTSSNCNGGGCGTVYQLTPSGNGYTESVLYSFQGTPDGELPFGGLVLDKKGNLFGTTEWGGDWGCFYNIWQFTCGTVFELTYVVGVGWTEQVLYKFQSTGDGGYWPLAGLIFDSAGNLYGTTIYGSSDGGSVFELSPSGDTWTFKVLYRFTDCYGPLAALSMDGAGNLYGTGNQGGKYDHGCIFKLSKTVNGWVYTSLHDFTGGTDGAGPQSNVAIDTDGTLYGTTVNGGDPNCSGNFGCGVVWMIKP